MHHYYLYLTIDILLFPIYLYIYINTCRVFKKGSPNGKITVYLGKRDFVGHIDSVDPIG